MPSSAAHAMPLPQYRTSATSAALCCTVCRMTQVGDITKDRAYWGSPERCTVARPATYLSQARPGTDAMAMGAAALAAAAVAIQSESLQVSTRTASQQTSTLDTSMHRYACTKTHRGMVVIAALNRVGSVGITCDTRQMAGRPTSAGAGCRPGSRLRPIPMLWHAY